LEFGNKLRGAELAKANWLVSTLNFAELDAVIEASSTPRSL
jgi:hypothetical protein